MGADTLVIIDLPMHNCGVGKEETSKNLKRNVSNTDVQMRSGEVDLDNVDLDNGYRLVNPVVESLATQGLRGSE